jgi:hypothetical protein
MDLNFEHLHLFIEGMKVSRESHAEENKSFEYGLNGRLYSYNGKLAFSSIKGTLEIYNDPNIIKYLGFYAFPDELVVFVKYASRIGGSQTSSTFNILGTNLTINISFGSTQHVFTNELLTGATENINTIIIDSPELPDEPLEDNYTEVVANQVIDLTEYYRLSGTDIANYEICDQNTLDEYEYNEDFDDAIIVFKNDGYHALTARIAWLGKMNWDINRKITTVGIDENMYYKRVYFTDNLNPLRVFNLKDNRLEFRNSSEFDIKQNAVMLQPKIKEIKSGGSIKAMTVQYAYKLITENGQVTTFSPYSEQVYIVVDDAGYDFEGGGVDEVTTKQVVIQIPILNLNFKEVQAIAIEFAADTIPTAIRNLGIKPINSIVEFTHNGNENEFSENFTLEDITQTGNIWTYCADITAKNNKLIAAGLRNEPYALAEKYVQDLFLFKGWDIALNTHDFLINPDPTTYRFIDPLNDENAVYLKKQLYNRFLFFGTVTLTLTNKDNPNASQSITFESSADEYIEYIEEVWTWLSGLDLTLFPNLQITRSNLSILFSPIDSNIETDLLDYYFEASISQAIIDFDNEYAFLTVTPNVNNLVYGAQSVGFNQGTGVRVTFKEVKEPVLNKTKELYESGPILALETPTLGKTFVKGEIYRMSIQFFHKGNPLFAIVLGDVYTPNGQDGIRQIKNDGTIEILTMPTYVNQSVIDDVLHAHRLEMRVEVRVPCLFKDEIDSYQIQYVERTENNRTILCQGISAPLIRLIDWEHPSQAGIAMAPNVYSKWTLPFNGGPLYTVDEGFSAYDDLGKGENYNEEDSNILERTNNREITNRRMMYFDSPDLIHDRISASLIENGSAHVIAKVNQDATGHLIRAKHPTDEIHESYSPPHNENHIYQEKAFSKKLGYSKIVGDDNLKPYVVNISIFSKLTVRNDLVAIENTSDLLTKGEIISSSVLGTTFDASNMALSLFGQGAYNSGIWRSGSRIKEDEGPRIRYSSQSGDSSNESHGYPTVFIRTDADLFTDDFIGPQRIPSHGTTYKSEYAGSDEENLLEFWKIDLNTSDSHAIINIKMNNADSIYGGRNKYAYSQNVFIPLGKVIPIRGSESDNQSQIFNIQGDFYVSLFLRTKNDYSASIETKGPYDLRQNPDRYRDHGSPHNSEYCNDYNRGAAWAYGVILETEVESRFTAEYQFYKSESNIDFNTPLIELINSAYFKKNNLRLYSPVPYNFKDDPLLIATLSASKTKLNGDYFDAWTEFLLNEFYDLEKNKGGISNVTNWKDSIFAIQQQESSEVFIDESDFVTTQTGENVAIQKGDGRTFTNHKKISDFGTSIRRALAEGELGFSFFDERNRAFVKFGQSLSLEQELQTKLHQLFEYDKIVDTEGYYDVKYKETNIRLRTESGAAYLLSYNELLGKFNGWFAYDHDIYMTFDKRVFVPCCAEVKVTIECPSIFSADSITVQVNEYFEYQIQATGNPIVFNVEDLPPGLNFNSETGLIWGTITTVGQWTFTVYAENEDCYDSLEIIVTANIDQLEGIAIGTAIVTGTLTATNMEIEGISNGSALVTGTLTWGASQISGVANGVATVTGTMTAITQIQGSVFASASTVSELMTLNLFFGGVAPNYLTQVALSSELDSYGSAGYPSRDAAYYQSEPGMYAFFTDHFHGAEYPYLQEVQTWVKVKNNMFYVDSFVNESLLTWVIDVQGYVGAINQGVFQDCQNMEWMYFPAVTHINSPSGYYTMRNLTKLSDYITFPLLTGLLYNLNHVLNAAAQVDVLHMPSITRIAIQYSDRHAFQNMTGVRRVYMPLLEITLSAVNVNVYAYNPLIDPIRDRRIFGGTSVGAGKIFYIHPNMETNRKSDVVIRVYNGVTPGETLTINGLTYTAVNGVKADNTQFRVNFATTWPHIDIYLDLKDSINNDTRIGTYGDIIVDQEFTPTGGPSYALLKSTLSGSASDAVLCSSTSPQILLSASNLMYGGTNDRNLVSWKLAGTEIRYVPAFVVPNPINDLSVSSITSNSCQLNFTIPTDVAYPVDFYEVWIYNGTSLKGLLVPDREITTSGAVITGLPSGKQHTIKIVVRDYYYNGSDFSNEITFVTL